jgi:hypothetical protein
LLRCMMTAILPSLSEERMVERRERTGASLKLKGQICAR